MRSVTRNTTTKEMFMNKLIAKLLVGVLFVMGTGTANAQSTANYLPTPTTIITGTNASLVLDMNGNAIDMTSGATSLVADNSDDIQTALTNFNLGSGSSFDFFLMGVRYTQFNASDNGVIGLGTLVGASMYTLPNSSSTIPTIAPFGNDMKVGTDGIVRAKVVGTTPNRCLVVEWRNVMIRFLATNSAGTGTFQARLYESTGVIEYVYGTMTTNAATPTVYYVGFSVGASANNIVTLNTTTNATATSLPAFTNTYTASSTITNLNSGADGSRKYYRFIPPTTTPPSGLTITSGSTTASLTWTNNGSNRLGTAIYNSTDNVTFNYVGTVSAASTGASITGLIPGTLYYWKLYAVSEGYTGTPLTGSQSTVASVTIASAATGNWSSNSTWTPSVIPGPLDNVTISDGHTVTVDITTAGASTVTVGSGSGSAAILQYDGTTTAKTLTTGSNITINANGTIRSNTVSPASTTNHVLSVGGNFTINGAGTFNGTASTNSKLNVTFTGASNASYTSSATSTNTFNLITINKGTTSASVLDFTPGNTVTLPAGFLTLTNGTFKFSGTQTVSNTFFSTAGYTIGATTGIWLNNPNVIVTGQGGSPTHSGLIRITSGIFNVGTGTGNSITGSNASSALILEGGTMNVAGRFSLTSGNVTISSGTISVCTLGSASSGNPSFNFGGSTFTMGGGNIIVVGRNTGATNNDYSVLPTTVAVTGGTLQIGNASSTSGTWRIQGNTPNLSMFSNGSTINASITQYGNVIVNGDLTLNGTGTYANSSTGLTIRGNSVANPGNLTINAGSVFTINSLNTSVLNFSGSFGNQTLTNSGTITTSELPSVTVNNSFASGTVTIPTGLSMMSGSTLTLTAGTLNAGTGGTGTISLGNATAGTFTCTRTLGALSAASSGFGAGVTTKTYTYNGAGTITTGAELTTGASVTINSLTLNDATANVTLNRPVTTGTFTLTNGTLVTTSSNILNVTGTTAGSVTRAAGFISGPMTRVLPASLVSGSIYLFPVGKGTYNPLELVNPTTNAGGTVTIKAEVFDANAGGTSGTNMGILNTNRYWASSVTAGAGNFTNSFIKLTDVSVAASTAIASGATLAGTYDIVGGTSPTVVVGTSITSVAPAATSLPGFYVLGTKAVPMVFASAAVTQAVTTAILKPANNQQIIGVQVLTTGNTSPLTVTSMDLNTTGSTSPAADISNARVWYTGTSSTFATTTQFGSDVPTPSVPYTVTGSQALAEGTNYFWLVYDVPPGATVNNLLDAVCTSVNVGTAQTPSPTTVAGNRIIKAVLNGVYTVGASQVSPNYTLLTNAIADLNAYGVSGPVTFQLAADYSSTTETFPLTINAFTGASAANTLTIKPSSGVTATISGSVPSNAVIKINAAKYVTIDGSNSGGTDRSLTIRNTNTTTARVLIIGSASPGTPAQNNTVKNCTFIYGTGTSALNGVLINDGGTGNTGGYFNDITIQNNSFKKMANGLIATASATNGSAGLLITQNDMNTSGVDAMITSGITLNNVDGATVSLNNIGNFESTVVDKTGIIVNTGSKNITVNQNNISAITTTSGRDCIGINVIPALASSNITISNNTISSLTNTSTSTPSINDINGIFIGGTASSGITVSGNTISALLATGVAVASGILTSGTATGIIIEKNSIRDIKNTEPTGYGANGIWLESISTSAATIVRNNFISDITGTGYTISADISDNGYGIIINAGAGYEIYHNTVHMNTSQANNGLPAAFNVTSNVTTANAINVRDNIFATSQMTGTNRYAIYCGAPSTVFSNINYNDYYSAGPNLGYRGSDRANLAAIVTGFGGNANSLNIAPTFVNPATDMHLTSANALLKAGTPIAGITTDYDGQTRNVTVPAIGADEIFVNGFWTGASSTVWDGAVTGNWDDGAIPTGGANIVVPAGVTNSPVLTGVSPTIGNLNLGTGKTLGLNGNTLTVTGAISGAGKLSGSSTSNLILNGAAGTLNFSQASASTRSIKNITFNSGATATLGDSLNVYGDIEFTPSSSNSFNVNGKNMTLKSTNTYTARIGNLTGTTLSGAGNVTVERFFNLRTTGGVGTGNTGRAYRLIAPTVNTTGHATKPTMKDNWMEGAMNAGIGVANNINPVPGYGVQITGAGANGNGFDITQSNAASLYATTNAVVPTYTPVPNTGAALNPLTGYFLYVRGDRSMDMTIPLAPGTMPTSSTTIRATGTLQTGNISTFTNPFTGGAGALNLVTNPYPSPIYWPSVYGDGTNITDAYTYWDPNVGNRGGFVTVNTAGAVNTPESGTPGGNRYIQSGQAFFIQASAATAPTLTMRETHKAVGDNSVVFIVPPPPLESFRTSLYYIETNNYRQVADGAIAVFGNYSAAVDDHDAFEINNWDENIAIAREGKKLAIESRPVILTRDTIPLFMNNMKERAYEFQFEPVVFTHIGLKAELIDKFLNTRTLLSVVNTTVVSFTVTVDPASKATDRFMVVFGPNHALAIDVLTIKAQVKNNGVQVDWSARSEKDMDRYELERSNDGMVYNKIHTTSAIGNSSTAVNYSWLDGNPKAGYNFYRIKAIDKAGIVKYTDIVSVNFGKLQPMVTVYPNPVISNSFGLQFTDMEKGSYSLAIINNMGQKVYSTQLQHGGGSANIPVTPGALAKGAYEVVLTGDKIRITTRIIKQ